MIGMFWRAILLIWYPNDTPNAVSTKVKQYTMATMLSELLRWQESNEFTETKDKVKEGIQGSDLAWKNLSNPGDLEH